MSRIRLLIAVAMVVAESASGAAAIATGIAVFTMQLRPWGIGDTTIGFLPGPAQWLGAALVFAGFTASELALRRGLAVWYQIDDDRLSRLDGGPQP